MAEQAEDWSKYAVKETPKDEWDQYAVKSDMGKSEPMASPEDVGTKLAISKDEPLNKSAYQFYNQYQEEKSIVKPTKEEQLLSKTQDISLVSPQERDRVQTLMDAIKANPKDPKFANDLAAYYLSEGKEGDARARYTQNLINNPDDAAAMVGLAHIDNSKGDYKEAAKGLSKAIQTSPQNAPALWEMAYAQSKLGNKKAALTYANIAGQIDPNNPYPNFLKGSIHAQLGDEQTAQAEHYEGVRKRDAIAEAPEGQKPILQGDKNTPMGLPSNVDIDLQSTPEELKYNEGIRHQIKFSDWFLSGGAKEGDDANYVQRLAGFLINPLGNIYSGSKQMVESGAEKTQSGAKDIYNGDVAAGSLKMLNGVGEIVFGGGGATMEGAKFMTALSAVPQPVQEGMMHLWSSLYKPESQVGKEAAGLADTITMLLGMSAMHSNNKPLQEAVKKQQAGEPLTPTDEKILQNGIAHATPQDLKDTQDVLGALPPNTPIAEAKKVVAMTADVAMARKAVETASPVTKPILEEAAKTKEEQVKNLLKPVNESIDKLGKASSEAEPIKEEVKPAENAIEEKPVQSSESSFSGNVGGDSPLESSGKSVSSDVEYRGKHQIKEPALTADKITEAGGHEDFFEKPSINYNMSDKSTKESYQALKTIKGKPDAEVTVYRAVPKGTKNINEGDWISLSKNYAKEHGMDSEDASKDMPVIGMKVKARDIGWDGNDINEFSYNPKSKGLTEAKTISQEHGYSHPTEMLNSLAKPENVGKKFDTVQQAIEDKDVEQFLKDRKEKAEIKPTKDVDNFNQELQKAQELHKKSYGKTPKKSLQNLLGAKQILDKINYPKDRELYLENDRLIDNYKKQLGIVDEKPSLSEIKERKEEKAKDEQAKAQKEYLESSTDNQLEAEAARLEKIAATPTKNRIGLNMEGVKQNRDAVVAEIAKRKSKPSLSEIKSKVITKAAESKKSAKKEGVSLKVQKDDLLGQIDKARAAVKELVEKKATQQEIKSKLESEGFETSYAPKERVNGEWKGDKAQVVFDVDGDGTFKLAADGLDIAYNEVKKHWKIGDHETKTGERKSLPKRESMIGNAKNKKEAEQIYLDAKENFETAKNSGNDDLINFYSQELETAKNQAESFGKAAEKPSVSKEDIPTSEKYYIHTSKGKKVVSGEEVPNKHGLDLFVHKTEDGFTVSEGRTGASMAEGETKQAAIDNTIKRIEGAGIEKVNDIVKNKEKEIGTTPRYEAKKKSLEQRIDESNKLKQEAKAKVGQALHSIAEKIGNIKNLTESEKTTLYEDIKKAIEGIAEVLKISIQEATVRALENLRSSKGYEANKEGIEEVMGRFEKEEPKTAEQVKKRVATERAYEGEVREEVKKYLEEKGLNREKVSQIERSQSAEEFINEHGEEVALQAVKKGDIKGATASSVIAKLIKRVDDEMTGITDANQLDVLAKKQSELIDLLGQKAFEGGEFNSQLAYEYQNSDIGYNLASMLNEKQDSLGVKELTDEQKQSVVEQFNKISEAKKEAEAKVEELQKKVDDYEAQKQVNRISREKRRGITKEKLDIEFDELSTELAKIAKSSFTASSGVNPALAAKAAVVVGKMARNRVEKGFIKLSEVVDSIYDKVKDSGLSKEDINDILAGKYTEKKTLSDINKILTELRAEARKNSPYGLEDVAAAKKRVEADIKRWEKKIADKDYSPTRKENIFDDPLVKSKFYKERKEALDAIVRRDDAKHQWAIDKANDALANRKLREKLYDWGMAGIHTARAIKAGFDDSFSFVQAGLTSLTHPQEFGKAWYDHWKDFTSERRFERELAAVHNAPYWDLVKKSELDYLEPKTMKQKESEGITEYNLLDQSFKIKGKEFNVGKYTTRPFERLFISMGNNIRLNIFLKKAQEFIDEGKTFESHPEDFKSLASVVNNMTARGNLHKFADNDLVRMGVWAPKMLASGFNMLGISDVVNPLTRQKGYYASLTPRMRKYAAMQTAKGIGLGLGIMGAIAYAGGYADFDPRSVTFGNVGLSKEGNHVNVFGRFAPIIRFLAIEITGKKVYPNEMKDRERWREAVRFARGKLAPHVGMMVDASTGETYMGAPFEWKTGIADLFTPLNKNEIYQALDEEGVTPAIRSAGAFEGMKTSKDSEYEDMMKENEDAKARLLPNYNPAKAAYKQYQQGNKEAHKAYRKSQGKQVEK